MTPARQDDVMPTALPAKPPGRVRSRNIGWRTGLLKLLTCALCLAAGYRGGEFFPLMFSGAAVGVATVAFVPGLQVTGALVAGLAAATTVGLRKPVAALLIGMFVVHGAALGPLVVGVAAGFLVLKLLPEPAPDAAPGH
jgi:H+/Cl- antiporter ClcA